MIDAYRIDGRTPASKWPYRLRINGEPVRNADGSVRKFHTLREACAYGKQLAKAGAK